MEPWCCEECDFGPINEYPPYRGIGGERLCLLCYLDLLDDLEPPQP